jgi:hypothetical protein
MKDKFPWLYTLELYVSSKIDGSMILEIGVAGRALDELSTLISLIGHMSLDPNVGKLVVESSQV